MRWVPRLGLLLIVGLVFSFRATGASLLQDSDTVGILAGLTAKPNAWVWFVRDWPLGNHFYRPFPSLVFFFDQALHPQSSVGFGATNALIVALCVGLTYWVVWEVWESEGWALAGTALFAIWCLDFGFRVPSTLLCSLCVAGWIALGILKRISWSNVLGLSAGSALFWFELVGHNPLYYRTIGWLPGRTATVMTVFCLIAMAAYLRAMRVGGYGWPLACLAATAGALMSYEQAVMLPVVLLLLGGWQYGRVQRFFAAGFFAEIAGYLALRSAVLPQTTSRYQNQQFRTGAGVWQSLALSVGLPFTAGLRLYSNVGASWEVLLLGSNYVELLWFVLPFIFWVWAWKQGRLRELAFPLACAALAFAPMAFLKPFDHYYFWPMAVRVLFVLGLARMLIEELRARTGVTLQGMAPKFSGTQKSDSGPENPQPDPF